MRGVDIMRQSYIEQLDNLYERFIQLGYIVKDVINEAVDAFEKQDIEKALAIIENDKYINEVEEALEQDCIQIIALQQPVTSDLRKVITIIKASTDFERIADHARGVAYATKRMSGERDPEIEEIILQMGQLVDEMMATLLKAIEEPNVLTAIQASRLDDQVDQYNKQITRRVADELLSGGESSQSYIEYKSISNDVERIGDYITNIAESVVYLETGEISELNPRYSKSPKK